MKKVKTSKEYVEETKDTLPVFEQYCDTEINNYTKYTIKRVK